MNIDLDFEGQPTGDAELETGLVPIAKPGTGNTGLESVYAENKKLVFVFDDSISMRDSVRGSESVDEYRWDAESLAMVRQKIGEASGWLAGNQERVRNYEDGQEDMEVEDNLQAAELGTLSDAELPAAVVGTGLAKAWSVPLKNVWGWVDAKSRMQVLKETAKELIEERVAQYPDSDIEAIRFSQHAVRIPARNIPQLLARISALTGEGMDTDIMTALYKVVDLCKKAPSPVHLHHVVLVTDGLDSRMNAGGPAILPTLKEWGIVLDVVLICNRAKYNHSQESSAQALENLAQATGGSCKVVDRYRSLRINLLEAGRRLLLPPAPEK